MLNMFFKNRLFPILLIWFIVTSSFVVLGDEKEDDLGQLVGFVTDPVGIPLAGAIIRVYFHGTYREGVSDITGYYEVTDIPLCYCLKNCTCSKDGYSSEWVMMAIGINSSYSFVLYPDTPYPVLDPVVPDGSNGWYISPVMVRFAYDPEVVASIYYSYNGGHQYQEPFCVNESCFIDSIEYYWIDFSGQQSPVYSFDIFMDLVLPTINLTWEKMGRWSKGIMFLASVYDYCSGIDYVEFYLNDVLQFTDDTVPYSWQMTHSSSNNIIKVVAYDLAGNTNCKNLNGSDNYNQNVVLDMWKSSKVHRVSISLMVSWFTILVQSSLGAFDRLYPSH